MTNDRIREKPSREDKKRLNDLVEKGLVTPNRPGNPRKGYSVRATPVDAYDSETYPGFADHPTTQGIEYAKHVDLKGTATVWEAIQNDNYASGGMPTWICENTSEADISIYWQMVHYQRVWDGVVKVSVRTLSRNVCIQYRSVQRCITNLLRVGLIVKVASNQGRKPNQYKVQLPSSIKPRTFASKRRKPGFIEVTAESVEVTAENSKGNLADTQKTKPLKGLVSEDRAKARLATTNETTDTTSTSKRILMTIDEETKARKKKNKLEIAKERKSLASKVRAYHEHEVSLEVLKFHLETCPPLRKLFDACTDISKVSGGLEEATGEVYAYWEDSPTELLSRIQAILTSSKFNVNNLDRAIELTLENAHRELTNLAKSVQVKKDAWDQNARSIQAKKEQDERDEKARVRALADAEALAIADAIAKAAENERRLQELIADKKSASALLEQINYSLNAMLPGWQKNFDVYGPNEALKTSNYQSKYWPLLEGLQNAITLLFSNLKWSEASEKIRQESTDAWLKTYKLSGYAE